MSPLTRRAVWVSIQAGKFVEQYGHTRSAPAFAA